MPEEEKKLAEYDALSLAYIGDGYYSLYVRQRVLQTGITKVRVIHDVVTSIICAKAQARSFLALEEEFTEEEKVVAHRGRNANVHVPKSAEPWEYRYSTALEAVFGYLYSIGRKERLDALCKKAVQYAMEES